ncbi:hypothetical protein V6N13_061960 [Hibiscus sabdariffa]|uniref:Uncharacterized protein n=2 Tax=Hibiscus sabdariffa TaxID=183260 RepID=A0ABR2AHQ8_9ROSI
MPVPPPSPIPKTMQKKMESRDIATNYVTEEYVIATTPITSQVVPATSDTQMPTKEIEVVLEDIKDTKSEEVNPLPKLRKRNKMVVNQAPTIRRTRSSQPINSSADSSAPLTPHLLS